MAREMTDKKSPADHFTAMAERILRNKAEEFQGCYVIVDPSGKVISQAFFGPEGDRSQFWGFVSGVVQVSTVEASQEEERRLGFNRVR